MGLHPCSTDRPHHHHHRAPPSYQVRVQAHFDTVENILVQLAGTKKVALAPPTPLTDDKPTGRVPWFEPFPFLHVHSRQARMPNGAEDFEDPSWRWRFKLDAGDALYIPPGTWHSVVATGAAASVSTSVYCASAVHDKTLTSFWPFLSLSLPLPLTLPGHAASCFRSDAVPDPRL